MPLTYDPEYYKAFEPFIPLLSSAPTFAVHDIQGRRAASPAMLGALIDKVAPPAPDVEQTEHKIQGPGGIQLAVYQWSKKTTDASSVPGPAILHAHGGGMIICDALSMSAFQKYVVQVTGVPIFSVDYRLAPESKDAALVEDVYAGLVWLNQNAAKFNVDPARIAVFGESAGGGIAAGVALLARDKGLSPPLAKQVLIYPMLDDRNITPIEAIEPFAFWKNDDNITGWTALLGDKTGKADADVSYYAAPARAKSVAGLPPTYIDVGGLDIFRDEDTTYAARIAAENIEVEYHLYPGLPHGFEMIAPEIKATKAAWENRLKALTSF